LHELKEKHKNVTASDKLYENHTDFTY